ncbi:MAG: hypothetical protein R6W80_09445 [Haliea sp.]
MSSGTVLVDRRFCGPPRSGNGGYVCGLLAAQLEGCARVRLRAPPPLDTTLQVEHAAAQVRLLHGQQVIAEAWPGVLDLVPPPAPSLAQSTRAAAGCVGLTRHVFPRCFVCGPQREAGDGLCIFPGPAGSAGMVAAPWKPDISLADASGRVAAEFLWAALDCPGFFAVMPAPEPGQTAVLGELCARIEGAAVPGEDYVVIGWPLGVDGRRRYSGTAIFSATGDFVAVARATWVEVAASRFGGS